jgi:hypothetical protein
MFSVITNIYNKKTKGPTLTEFFSFPVTVKNSIKAGPLVFFLQMFVITENIMKLSVYLNWVYVVGYVLLFKHYAENYI